MKRLGVITLGCVLVMAHLLWLARPAVELRSNSVPACCLKRAVNSASATQTSQVTACCRHACCVQSPAVPLGQVPLVPLSPDLPRVLTSVVLTVVWSLPASPSELATPAASFATAVQDATVPLFARHCTLLI